MSSRYCDYIEIYRPTGDVYNPFGEVDSITEELVFEGDCKANIRQQNDIDAECYYDIYIYDPEVKVQSRDVAYFYSNSDKEDKVKLVIITAQRFARNTVINAMHLKDGEDLIGDGEET
jgi:hypothetical protein